MDVTRALEAARSVDVTRAVEAARSIDVTRAVEAARAVQDSAWSFARTSDFAWEPQSDRDRELSRAQREKEEADREKERAQREKERENSYYDQGQQALDQSRWDRAVASFDRVIELKGTKSDAAMYWKAYAQNKLGQQPEALDTISADREGVSEEPLPERREGARSRGEDPLRRRRSIRRPKATRR